MTRALLDYFATDRASPLCSQNKRDKNSNRNSARVACLMKFVGGDTHTECQGNVIAQTALRLWQPPQMSFRGVKRRGNPLNRNATQWRLPLTALVLAITTAQKIFAIKIRRIRNRTAVSQDCLLGEVRLWRKRINENLFRAFLYTECAYSGCEPQRRREKGAPSLMDSTSDCAVLLRSWRTKRSDTAFSRFVLQTSRMPFVACNELAIVTKSIASVLPHAERTPWVPF